MILRNSIAVPARKPEKRQKGLHKRMFATEQSQRPNMFVWCRAGIPQRSNQEFGTLITGPPIRSLRPAWGTRQDGALIVNPKIFGSSPGKGASRRAEAKVGAAGKGLMMGKEFSRLLKGDSGADRRQLRQRNTNTGNVFPFFLVLFFPPFFFRRQRGSEV